MPEGVDRMTLTAKFIGGGGDLLSIGSIAWRQNATMQILESPNDPGDKQVLLGGREVGTGAPKHCPRGTYVFTASRIVVY